MESSQAAESRRREQLRHFATAISKADFSRLRLYAILYGEGSDVARELGESTNHLDMLFSLHTCELLGLGVISRSPQGLWHIEPRI